MLPVRISWSASCTEPHLNATGGLKSPLAGVAWLPNLLMLPELVHSGHPQCAHEIICSCQLLELLLPCTITHGPLGKIPALLLYSLIKKILITFWEREARVMRNSWQNGFAIISCIIAPFSTCGCPQSSPWSSTFLRQFSFEAQQVLLPTGPKLPLHFPLDSAEESAWLKWFLTCDKAEGEVKSEVSPGGVHREMQLFLCFQWTMDLQGSHKHPKAPPCFFSKFEYLKELTDPLCS